VPTKRVIHKTKRRFRFSPYLVLKLKGDGGVEAILGDTGIVLTAELWLLQLVENLHSSKGFTEEDFRDALTHLGDSNTAALAFCTFSATNIIIPWSNAKGSVIPTLSWRENGWEVARLFHEATAHASFLQGDTEGWQQQLQQCEMIGRTGESPPIVKTYQDKDIISLEEPIKDNSDSFFKVLSGRRTCRKFSSDRRLNKSQLSTILHYAARAQSIVQDLNLGPHLLRTSPSGGARHPVDIYPQLFRVNGIPSGSFYYDPQRHTLTLLGPTSEDLIYRIGQQQSGCRNMPVAFLITARFARNLWKYRYPKSYIFTLFDVAHFVQTFILCCEAMRLKCFLTPALNVSMAQAHLDLTNIYDECSTYLVTAG
jgi:SagB-type dehydrogenase family enzyme